MDHFKEEAVVRQNKAFFTFLVVVVTLAMIASGVFAALFFVRIQNTMFREGFNWLNLVLFFVFAAVLVGLFWVRVNLRFDYEYSFTNGELDVDKVINNTKRKHIVSLDMRKITQMAPVEDPSFTGYDSDPSVKHIYAVLNRHTQIYYCAFNAEDSKKILLFEPSREMVEMMKYYNPSKITIAKEDPDQ